MIKVFLVEDEVVMRNGIKKNIPWAQEGFDFVGEASDGELAYPLIKSKKPDIVITDIKMPFMDGLELSRIIKKEMPQVKIIILSGYNEFDYAKTAISIGVTEYLLKPISSAKLLEAVKKVGELIEQEQEQARMLELYRREMKENIELQKHNLWISLASNQLSMSELLDIGYQLDIDFTASSYQVVLFKLIAEEMGSAIYTQFLELFEKINAVSEQWEKIITFDRSPDGWAFLIKGNSEDEVNHERAHLMEELGKLLHIYPEVEYFGGIGTIVQRLRDVSSSYQHAAKAFASRYFMENNQILEGTGDFRFQNQETEKIEISRMHSKKYEQELLERFLKNGTQEEVSSFVGNYLEVIGRQNYQSLMYRQYILMDIYFIVTDFLRSLELSVEDLKEEHQDINGIVVNATSAEHMDDFLQGLFEDVLALRDNHSRKRNSVFLEEAQKFIRENYQSEAMSLNAVAAQINMSPSYFSTIFSAQTGQTFVEYLTSVRLEKAKELLMCSNMRSAEIGYEVGYKDSHYFSYLFKKVVGCTPREYRNRGKEQEA